MKKLGMRVWMGVLLICLLFPSGIYAAKESKASTGKSAVLATKSTKTEKTTAETKKTEKTKTTAETKKTEKTKTTAETKKTEKTKTTAETKKTAKTKKTVKSTEAKKSTKSKKIAKTTTSTSKKKKKSKAQSKKKTRQQEIDQGTWVNKEKYICYKDCNKKKVTGLVKIKDNKYYFDEKGRQRTGWREIGGSYYFFRIAKGKKGYMVTDSTVNSIKLQKSGKAKIASDTERKKLKVMVLCSGIVDKKTNLSMKKKEKLRILFDYVKDHYSYIDTSFSWYKAWVVDYGWDMVTRECGTCYHYGVLFAFLASAVGYEDVNAVSSGGHGWAEVDGKVCDPSWQKADRRHSYFLMPMNLSGVDGRPRYRTSRLYVVKI